MDRKTMRKTMLPLLLILWAGGYASAQVPNLLSRLSSPDATDAARNEVVQESRSNPKIISELSQVLPSMLLAAPNDKVMESEAVLAGELRIESTIPALITLLAHPIYMAGGGLYYSAHLLGDPVARALYAIGPPAELQLAEALHSASRLQRSRAMQVLILGNTKRGRAILAAHEDAEPDPWLRGYIAANLKRMAHP